MKLPKSLLAAIVIGIAVQTTSCSKDKDVPDPKKKEANKEAKKEGAGTYPDNCPACGMG